MDVNTLLKGGKDCRLSSITKKSLLTQQQAGFTLLELVFTLAIITIASFTLPGVSASFIYSNKVVVAVNQIAADMAYARSEAVTRSQNVQLCKTLNGLECTRSNQWETGWMIFVDENQNRKRELSEPVLKYQPKVDAINITYRGSGSSHYIRFRADGASGVNGTFAFCSDSAGQYKRALILFRTGRLRLSKTRAGGQAISCANFRNNQV